MRTKTSKVVEPEQPKFNFSENYISITLGFLVILVAGILLFNFITRNKGTAPTTEQGNEESNSEQKSEEITGTALLPITHTVVENETLWSIAEKYYGSGYNWVSIAQENKLTNANVIEKGTVLTIPKADVIKPVGGTITASSAITEKSYTVVTGDNLWNIAVRVYGDGFAWTKIATANHLTNPRVIHPGNVLQIP